MIYEVITTEGIRLLHQHHYLDAGDIVTAIEFARKKSAKGVAVEPHEVIIVSAKEADAQNIVKVPEEPFDVLALECAVIDAALEWERVRGSEEGRSASGKLAQVAERLAIARKESK